MPRLLALLGLAALAPMSPLWGQIGLTSATQSIALSAYKAGTVGVTVSAAPDGATERTAISASWNVDPRQIAALSVVAYFDGAEPEGGRVVFTQAITPGTARGRRDSVAVGRDWAGMPVRPVGEGTFNLLVITQ